MPPVLQIRAYDQSMKCIISIQTLIAFLQGESTLECAGRGVVERTRPSFHARARSRFRPVRFLRTRPQNLPLLEDADLDALKVHARIHPSPSQQNTPDLAFPSIIYECKSELQPIYFAENQAADAAAKALKMVEELMEAAERTDLRLPIFAMCSCGSFWRIYVAYSTALQRGRRVVSLVVWLAFRSVLNEYYAWPLP